MADTETETNSSKPAIILLDEQLCVLHFSETGRPLFIEAGDLVGRSFCDLETQLPVRTLEADIRAGLQDRVVVERRVRSTDGRDYHCFVAPEPPRTGRSPGVFLTIIEVPVQPEEGVNDRLLQVVGHDLRQPVQAIVMFMQLLKRRLGGQGGNEAAVLVNRIDRSVERIQHILGEMHLVARIESGRIVAEPAVFPVDELLMPVTETASRDAEEQRIDLRYVACRQMIRTDPDLLSVLVQSLLNAAISASQAGKLLLGCRRRGDRLAVVIADTGPGLSDAVQSAILDEHRRLKTTGSMPAGMGFGYYLVACLSKLLHLPVFVYGRTGRGTRVEVWVPICRASEAPWNANVT